MTPQRIEWSKLSPEERYRVVCMVVGIHPVDNSFNGIHKPGFKFKKTVKIKWPKVSTDANEALKVWVKIGPSIAIEPGIENGTWKCTLKEYFGRLSGCYDSICHAICIAALRAKGHEVIL